VLQAVDHQREVKALHGEVFRQRPWRGIEHLGIRVRSPEGIQRRKLAGAH